MDIVVIHTADIARARVDCPAMMQIRHPQPFAAQVADIFSLRQHFRPVMRQQDFPLRQCVAQISQPRSDRRRSGPNADRSQA